MNRISLRQVMALSQKVNSLNPALSSIRKGEITSSPPLVKWGQGGFDETIRLIAAVIMCATFCLALLLWSGIPVNAAEEQTKIAAAPSLAEMSIEQLMNIEITIASKKPERYFDTPAAIYVITNEDIKRSGVTSIAEALRLAPGVEVARINSNQWAVSVRGRKRPK